MADTAYPRVVSERETREWIPTCPVQIKKIRIEQAEPDGGLTLTLESLPCGDFGPVRFTADLLYQNGRRERIGGAEGLSFVTGASEPVPVPFPEAVYAQAVVRSAVRKDGTLWENPEGNRGEIPPAQKVILRDHPQGVRGRRRGPVRTG